MGLHVHIIQKLVCMSFRSQSLFTLLPRRLLLSYCQTKHLSWFSYSMKVKGLLADIHCDKSSGLKLVSQLGFAINHVPSPSRTATKPVFVSQQIWGFLSVQ